MLIILNIFQIVYLIIGMYPLYKSNKFQLLAGTAYYNAFNKQRNLNVNTQIIMPNDIIVRVPNYHDDSQNLLTQCVTFS